jgi:outer membrane lipoprotein-sorting protein
MSKGTAVIRTLLAILVIGGLAFFGASGSLAASEKTEKTERMVLSPDDSAAVRRAVRYLNRISTLKARFIQISSNGAYAEGEVLISRPGKLRFDYDPPHPVLLIANGLTLLFYDRELKQASFLPLWETPLWFLIRQDVTLTENVHVTAVVQEKATIRISLVDEDLPDAGEVTLVFSDRPLVLTKWEILDPQGTTTQVSLVNPQFGVEIDSEAFDYSDLEIGTGVSRDETR